MSMKVIFIILIVLGLLFLIGSTYLLIRLKKYIAKKRESLISQKYDIELPSVDSYKSLTFINYPKKEFQSKMNGIKSTFLLHDIGHIFFIHGTFVGDDPFDLFHLFEKLTANEKIQNIFTDNFHKQLKKTFSFSHGDNGNFSDANIQSIKNIFQNDIQIHPFKWSSGNHHYARIKGALDLIQFVAHKIAQSQNESKKILFIGHSHAGQLMAIMSQLLKSSRRLKSFYKAMKGQNIPKRNEIQKSLNLINNKMIYAVTMGTPARYLWNLGPQFRLLNIINHRGQKPLGGPPQGAAFTRAGDYIQQWGIIGSDFKSPSPEINEINLLLNKLLGPGHDFSLWVKTLAHKKRVPDNGYTLLVDYLDSSLIPNFTQTIFGHGVYTQKKTIIFNFEIIIDFLLKKSPNKMLT